MQTLILAIRYPEKNDSRTKALWDTLTARLESQLQLSPTVRQLSKGVWLLSGNDAPRVIATVVASCESDKLGYSLLIATELTQWHVAPSQAMPANGGTLSM